MNTAHWEQLLPIEEFKVTREQYEEFRKQYVVYALADKRYGQAFCEHFNFRSILYYFKDREICESWIKSNHLIE